MNSRLSSAPVIHRTMQKCFMVLSMILGVVVLSTQTSRATVIEKNSDHPDNDTVVIHVINDLNFGSIYCGQSAGTVTISPNGDATAFGGVMIERSNGQSAKAASFTITLRGGANGSIGPDEHKVFPIGGSMLSIVFPTSAELRNSTGESMSIDNFTILRHGAKVDLGATLHVNATQAGGVYQGVFLIMAILE